MQMGKWASGQMSKGAKGKIGKGVNWKRVKWEKEKGVKLNSIQCHVMSYTVVSCHSIQFHVMSFHVIFYPKSYLHGKKRRKKNNPQDSGLLQRLRAKSMLLKAKHNRGVGGQQLQIFACRLQIFGQIVECRKSLKLLQNLQLGQPPLTVVSALQNNATLGPK